MKSTSNPRASTRPLVSSREVLALATFVTATHAAAATPAAPKKEESTQQKEEPTAVLKEMVVDATRQSSYKADKLSSQKSTAPLLNTPQTFSVIPKEVYTEQSARNLTDVLKNVPGISFNAGENGFSTGLANFSMRGIDTSGSIFTDGVRDSGSYVRDVFNLERVEVAKGAAADNGRGTAGGYVNLVTKTPQLNDFYSGIASYTFDEYAGSGNFRNTFDFNQSVKNSPLEGTAIRFNALLQDGGVPGRDIAENNAWGVAPSIAIGLGTPTRFTLAYQHLEQNLLPDWGVPAAVFKGMDAYDSSIGGRRNRDTFYGLKSDYDDTVSDTLLATIEHDFANGVRLTNQTRWAKTDREALFTVPTAYNAGTGLVTTQQQAYDRENTSISNQTNLLHEFKTGSIKHTLSTGLEYTHETSESARFGTVNNPGTGAPVPVNDPDPDRASGRFIPAPTQFSDIEIDTVGAYLYDTIELNPQWQVTGGLRVEHYHLDFKNTHPASALPSFEQNETTVGGKLGVVYKPAENGSIYASAGISALPPGSFLSNPDISREGDNAYPNLKPDGKVQNNINLEIGTKWDFFSGRLSTTAALFQTTRNDIPVDTPTGPNPWEYTDQVLHGIELGVAGQITNQWAVFGGLLLMDSERKNNSNVDDFRGDDPGIAVDGDELAFTPNFSANLWTTYQIDDQWTIGGGLQYVGSSYLGRPDDASRVIYNGKFGELPDYVVFNAMTSYKINDNVTVRLNVDNVFDEVYAVSSNWPGTRAFAGPPRTYTVSADWKF